MKNYLFLLLGIIILVGCSTDEPEEVKTYSVSGKVVDENNNGISNIEIQTSLGQNTVTNNEGDWAFSNFSGINTIFAISNEYKFEPNEIVVSESNTNLIFEGTQEISENEILLTNWLNNHQLSNGLLESTENGNIVSLYDNALAILSFIAYENYAQAEQVLDFFNNRIDTELLVGNGGFSQFRDANGTPSGKRWLGDNAWLLIAANNYKFYTQDQKYNRLITELENWIIGLQDSDGGIWGGYNADNSQIHKITEGNIDAFNAVNGYTSFHQNLLNFLENDRWNETDKLLIAWETNPQYYYAMDLHPWGYCIFEDFPIDVLTKANRYLNTQIATVNNEAITGYCFDEDKDAVWTEGTGQMVVAFKKANQENEANTYLNELEKIIIPSSLYNESAGIPYASNLGTSYGNGQLWLGADTKPAISGVTWYLFGKRNFDPFALNYNKNVPLIDRFWLD